jgi:glycosyltransferase involved in cell wall biosynthesis
MSIALEPVPAVVETADAPRDLLMILGFASWSGALRRGLVMPDDRLTIELLRSERVGRLLVCNPYRSAVAKLVRTATGRHDAAFPASATRRLYEPLRLRRQDATSIRAIERSCAAYERAVRRAADRFGLERPAIITSHPLVAGFGSFDWAGPVTYYAIDDLRAHPVLSRWWQAYDVAHASMRERGRRAVGVTEAALARVDPSGPAAVIPNGIDAGEWSAPGPAPRWFTELPGPRMLYVGSLDPRVEVEAVRATATAYPNGSVVLIGRCPDPDHYASLRDLPNVTIAPPVGRAELVGLVAAADVGLIPHVRNELTEAMSPLKLYEYLAAGLPVAAVDLPGIASVSSARTALAHGADDFVAAVARALELVRSSEADRLAFIHANAWERRFEHLLDLALAN